MKSGYLNYKLALAIFFISACHQVLASENSEIKILNAEFKVDFMSLHTWRGFASNYTPTIEPSFEITRNNNTTGVWVAHSLDGNYSELDLYFTYTLKDFSFTVYDYFCPQSYKESNEITNYNNLSTKHIIELDLAFNGNERFPFSVLVATMVYGYDRDPETQENIYSTYFQFGYSAAINESSINFVLGFNAFESVYGDQFGVVNAGVGVIKNITAFKTKEIPLQTSLVANPMANTLFLKFGFTL